MNINNIIIITSFVLLTTSCNSRDNNNKGLTVDPLSAKITSCSINNEKFGSKFFPFDLEEFSLSKMMTHINGITEIDSMMNGNKFYYFKNNSSNFSIVVNENRKAYLNGGSISSNFFKSKNGIEIGMTRKDFFSKTGQSDDNCPTFTIIQNSMMYHFNFKNNKLASIDFDGI